MIWGIRKRWAAYEASEIVKETDKTILYVDKGRRQGKTRVDRSAFFAWRGNEETAGALVARLNSARSEYDRRTRSANDWFDARIRKILASGMETATADETEGLGPKGDSPTAEGGDAHNPGPSEGMAKG